MKSVKKNTITMYPKLQLLHNSQIYFEAGSVNSSESSEFPCTTLLYAVHMVHRTQTICNTQSREKRILFKKRRNLEMDFTRHMMLSSMLINLNSIWLYLYGEPQVDQHSESRGPSGMIWLLSASEGLGGAEKFHESLFWSFWAAIEGKPEEV